MQVSVLDHCVLTVADVEATVAFYTGVLGMTRQVYGEGRVALLFGEQKINLHPVDSAVEPKSSAPRPGSADLCFLIDTPLEEALAHVRRHGVDVIAGPVSRTGATGPIRSFYFRDPDGNLIELANPA